MRFSNFNIDTFIEESKFRFIDNLFNKQSFPSIKNMLRKSDKRTRSKNFIPRFSKNILKKNLNYWLPVMLTNSNFK